MPSALSAREIEVLRLRCAGLKVREVADALNITPNTVKSHMGSVWRITKARTSEQLGAWAERNIQSESRPGATPQSGLIPRNGAAAADDGAGL